ncbi:MAG: haloacid dehalogenase-like hydrolase [Fidelibacterota bacterium]|nr:MAG: haloacid dehalogenase-like hydrolase [Candidatus Neomarinimicrobiota bacterium]
MSGRKLILFDIDGTLITPGPIPRRAMAEAISHFLGSSIELSFYDVAGLTDPVIIRNAIGRHDAKMTTTDGEIEAILDHFLGLVEQRLPPSNEVRVFPGAEELVRACQQEGWVAALLTGNMERGARIKLASTGLWDLFAFGVYGGDGNARVDLPWVARERAWDMLQESFRPTDTILIGDTPNDARVAQQNNIASLIVCRREESEWRQAIEAEKPTWLVKDFDDVPHLIKLMRGE